MEFSRFSVGIEDVKDIKEDIRRTFKKTGLIMNGD